MTVINTSAPGARVQADTARRTITGMVVPWGTFAQVSTGQTVAFARGSLSLGERSKLVLDHDPSQPVAVYASSTDTDEGLMATWRVPAGARGDQILAEAGDLRDGLSVAADIQASDDQDGGLWVTAAKGRHVALLSEPAYDTARVTAVAASQPIGAPPVTVIDTTATPVPPAEPAPPADPAPTPPTITAAGLAATTPAPARTVDAYPYAQPLELGGPSFVRDAWKSDEDPSSPEAERWRRAMAMGRDPAYLRAGLARFGRTMATAPGADIAAATGTTVTEPALSPVKWLPGRYVSLRGAKAPLYTALAKFGVPDFSTLEVPRTASETGLSGIAADEVTPVTPGTITVTNDTVNIEEIEGAYLFSRKLLMSSNPQIDRIALDALDRAWLANVETEAVKYFVQGANVHTAVAGAYTDGPGYIKALRGQFAALAAATLYQATDVIPASKEYVAAAEADDTTGRGLLPYGPQVNASGESSAGYSSVSVQGTPLWPGPYMPANETLILDQSVNAAVCFATPVMNFRLEWTTDVATGGNVKVLKLVKYSGVGFWAQYPGGIVLMTNGTPLALEAGDQAALDAARDRREAETGRNQGALEPGNGRDREKAQTDTEHARRK